MTTPVPDAAIAAAAKVLHDEGCCDGDTSTCGRWNSRLPGYDGLKHIGYYEDRGREVLAVAAPHIAVAERDRIRQLALSEAVRMRAGNFAAEIRAPGLEDFAALLADPPVPAVPTEGTTP